MDNDFYEHRICPTCHTFPLQSANCGSCSGSLGWLCASCGDLFPSGECRCEEGFWPLACDFCGYSVFPGECPHITIEDFLLYGTIPADVKAQLTKEKREKDGQC